MRLIELDHYSVAQEIKPNVFALRQTSISNSEESTIYLTADMIKWLAEQV